MVKKETGLAVWKKTEEGQIIQAIDDNGISSEIIQAIDDNGISSETLTEYQQTLVQTQKLTERLFEEIEDSMMKTGTLLDDMETLVTEGDISAGRRALARLPGAKFIPGLKNPAKYLSHKEALERTTEQTKNLMKRVEALIEPFKDDPKQFESEISRLAGERTGAIEKLNAYRTEVLEIKESIGRLNQQLGELPEDGIEYATLESQIITLEQRERYLGREMMSQQAQIEDVKEALDTFRALAPVIANYVGTAEVSIHRLKSRFDKLDPVLQKQAALAQISEALDNLMKSYEVTKKGHNASLYIIARKGEVVSRVVEESMDAPFYHPKILQEAEHLGLLGQGNTENRKQLLLYGEVAEPTLPEKGVQEKPGSYLDNTVIDAEIVNDEEPVRRYTGSTGQR